MGFASVRHMLICKKKNIIYLWFNTFGYFFSYGKSGDRKIQALVQPLRWVSPPFWPYSQGCKSVPAAPHSKQKEEGKLVPGITLSGKHMFPRNPWETSGYSSWAVT